MPRLALRQRVPAEYNRQVIDAIIADLQNQINNLSEGMLTARYNAQTTFPTTGTYNVGDIVYNATPSELGMPGSKYILLAWMCTVSDPLTFRELRCLTGN
jgi:hypothetical protein